MTDLIVADVLNLASVYCDARMRRAYRTGGLYMAKPYTAAELREFDRLTEKMCSHNQMDRITGRLDCKEFEKKHGAAKCKAMFVALKDRDNKRRRINA